jgi:hypothetical protein
MAFDGRAAGDTGPFFDKMLKLAFAAAACGYVGNAPCVVHISTGSRAPRTQEVERLRGLGQNPIEEQLAEWSAEFC